jgi:hypothetical protein
LFQTAFVLQHFLDFSKSDWLKLLPLRHAFKQVRNDLVQRAYLKQLPQALPEFLRENSPLQDKNIALIIAFEQPRVLDFLLGKARGYLPDARLLVFDNSPKATARAEIKRVCQEHKIPYLALPPNSVKHPNRSHGMAMTWIFRNVVRAIKPRMFAFIDHDLIPFQTVEFTKTLAGQPFYGPVRTHKSAEPEKIGNRSWSLWAGYCMYDFSAVKHSPLNFLYDFSRGLDTGGRNWHWLYKNYDQPRPAFADSRKVSLTDSRTGIVHQIRIVDGRWLHFRGAGYREDFQENLDLYMRMANALAEAGAEATSF